MKKKILLPLLAFTSLFIPACGGNTSSSQPSSSQSSTLTTLESNQYCVRVFYPNGRPVDSEEVTVQWCNETNCFAPVRLDSNGIAVTTINDDSNQFTIHLDGLPEGYCYNPFNYVATPNDRDIRIVLTQYNNPSEGNGTSTENPYQITEGTYEVNIENSDDMVYFQYRPTKPGIYTIESWAYSTLGITTSFSYFSGNSSYIPETPLEVITSGGYESSASGMVCSNFKYELTCPTSTFLTSGTDKSGNLILEEDENGNNVSGAAYTFGVSAETLLGTSFPLSITYSAPYEEPKTETVQTILPQKNLTTFPNAEEGYELTPIPMDGSVNFTYNTATDTYHIDDENSSQILIMLNEKSEYLDIGISEFESKGQSQIYDSGKKNYSEFIAQYSAVCNEDGVYPANSELKTFIDLLIDHQNYFQPNYGWISTQIDYTVETENQWLFICYYYAIA